MHAKKSTAEQGHSSAGKGRRGVTLNRARQRRAEEVRAREGRAGLSRARQISAEHGRAE